MNSISLFALTLIFCAFFLVGARTAGADVEQDLGLKLVGTAIGDEPGKDFAIIKILSTGSQGAFREGDRMDDIRIKKIMPGYVIIDTRGGEVTLSLGPGENPGGSVPPPENGRVTRKEVYSKLPDYRHLMDEIRVRPRFEAGQPSGFVIYKIEPESIFARMGLRDGDVIVKVNGRAFDTTQPVVEFYETILDGGPVALDVRRGDRRRELHFEIR